jgi:hypothetical protein
MISNDDLENYIAEIGYRTFSEIQTKFASEDREILSMYIVNLTSRKKIKRIKFQKSSKVENDELFYIPYY